MVVHIVMLTELLFVATVILALHRFKSKITLAPLFIFIGTTQYSQHFLSSAIYVEIFGGLTISSGSFVFFSGTIFAILLIYLTEGVPQTRTLIVGIVLSNLTLTLLGGLTAFEIESIAATTPVNEPRVGIFQINYRIFSVGTLLLVLDSFLIVIIYQFLESKAKFLKLFGRILFSLTAVLIFDSILFTLGSFLGQPGISVIMGSQVFGKALSGSIYAIVLFVYLKYLLPSPLLVRLDQAKDIFSIITYRRRFKDVDENPSELEGKLTEQLFNTLDAMSDGFVSFDTDWRVTYLSDVAREIIGRERARTLVGKVIWDIFPEEVGGLFYENCYLAAANKEQITFDFFSVPFNRWFSIRAIPSTSGLSVFGTDITESKEKAHAIELSNQRNKALLSAMPDLMFDIDKNGIFIDIHNPHGRETLAPTDSYIGASIYEVLSPELAKETQANIEKTLRTGEIVIHNYELELNGTTNYFEARYVKNTEDDVFTVVRDITSEEAAKSALMESEMKYRSLIQQASDAILIHDMSGIILEINDAGLKYVDRDRDEIIGSSLSDHLFKEDLVELPIPFARLKRGETTVTRRRIKRKDGSEIWMDISSRMNIDGNVIAITRDITSMLANEKAIMESENRFRTLTESAPIGIFQTTLGGECTYVNDQWLILAGMTFEEAVGDGWAKGIHPEDRERVNRDWKESIDNNKKFYSSFRWQATDGKVTDSEVHAVMVSDHKGEKLGFIGTVGDVTEKKKADAELKLYRDHLEELVEERTRELQIEKVKAQSADKIKSAFLATMSHELRTPLNSIIGFTGLLLNELAGPVTTEQKKQLEMVKNSGRHLLGLINDILDLSKIEAGELSFSKNSYDFGASVANIIHLIKPLADSKGLKLSCEMSPEKIQFVNDKRRVEQILINLLDNAVKFTSSGTISLKCVLDDKILAISVADTGIGIKDKDIKKLFIPFSQIDSGLTRNHQGTGLGLSISQKLVKMLGGKINVESKFGRGSIFTVEFPNNRAKLD